MIGKIGSFFGNVGDFRRVARLKPLKKGVGMSAAKIAKSVSSHQSSVANRQSNTGFGGVGGKILAAAMAAEPIQSIVCSRTTKADSKIGSNDAKFGVPNVVNVAVDVVVEVENGRFL